MPNSTLGPVQIFSLDLCSINLALMEIQNRLDEGKGLRGEAIVNDRVRLHNTPVQDLNVEPDIVTNVYAETPRGVPPLQQVEALLATGLVGLQPLVAPPAVGNTSLIGSDLTRYASEGHTHEGVNLADAQTIVGTKTLGAATVGTGKLNFAGVTSGVVTVQAADIAGTWSLTLPTTDGNAGEALLTDGNGITSWGVPGGIVPTTRTLTITGTANQVTVTPNTAQDLSADRSWAIALTGPYTPATYTAHGVLVGEGTSSIVALTVGTNGQVLLGSTGADPVFATLGAGAGISYTPGAGTLTITNTGATSVSNSDGSLTISPTTGAVVASLNVAHSNIWTAVQTIDLGSRGTTPPSGTILHLMAPDSTAGYFVFNSYSAASGIVNTRSRLTAGVEGAVVAGNRLGAFIGRGHDGTSISTDDSGYFGVFPLSTWTNSNHETYLALFTTANGATGSGVERVRVALGLMCGTTTDSGAGTIRANAGFYTEQATFMLHSTAAWNNGAGALTGTLTNSPATGNPTKWIPVDDNGTTRYIPAW